MKTRYQGTWLALAIIGMGLAGAAGCGNAKSRAVLYCAQDQEFADQVLGEFTHRTGLKVDPKFDTEADKSVSLYVELVSEKARPRCDVHWNNEILSTIRLQRQGLLDPYRSPSAEPYPASAKARDDTWHAFAARAQPRGGSEARRDGQPPDSSQSSSEGPLAQGDRTA